MSPVFSFADTRLARDAHCRVSAFFRPTGMPVQIGRTPRSSAPPREPATLLFAALLDSLYHRPKYSIDIIMPSNIDRHDPVSLNQKLESNPVGHIYGDGVQVRESSLQLVQP